MTRIVVDPITRIEGHLRIEAIVENGVIKDAFSTGPMARALEKIVVGRDPRDIWAMVERVCGVCTGVHALASVRAVEDAIGVTVPPTAELVRNLMFATLQIHDHVVHFYHLHALDWVDVVSVLKADPAKTAQIASSISPWPRSSPTYFAEVQKRIKGFVDSGQLGIFANGYWGNAAYKLPPELNLLAVAHYLDALEWQKEIVKIHAIFGGKNPHPNYLVGGVPCSFNMDEVNALNSERLNFVQSLITLSKEFVEQVYIPDVLAIAGFYKDTGKWGGGVSNYLAYGDMPTRGYGKPEYFRFPRGAILDRNLKEVHPVNPRDDQEIKEYISHSWYDYSGGDNEGLHPWKGETKLHYTGPKPPFTTLEGSEKYSFLKTPRWKGHAMEVGPLARVLVGYASGKSDFVTVVNDVLKKLDLPVEALFSTLGRTAARAIDCLLIQHWMQEDFDALKGQVKLNELSTFNGEKWQPSSWPDECEGVGLCEAPRGALAHYIKISKGKVVNYQLVVPTTWNGSPRDAQQQRSPFEASLIGVPCAKPDEPVELLRTIHSFDPCMACSVHFYDPSGAQLFKVTTE